jgi:hypothetical protein
MPGVEIRESTQPHEVIGSFGIAELSEHIDSDRLLRFDELAVEHLDKSVALAGAEQVLPKFDQIGHDVDLSLSVRVHCV